MEMPVHIKALTGEVFAQGPTESGRAAEPDARLPPVGYGGAYALAGQVAVAAGDQQVPPGLRAAGIVCQSGQRVFVDVGGAVEEVHRAGVLRVAGRMPEAGDEGSDADAAAHPDLSRAIIIEGEAAVGAFHGNLLTDAQLFAQSAGMVPQFLDHEADLRVLRLPAGGNGVGVKALAAIRHGEGELTGLVPRPARDPCVHLQGTDAGEVMQTGNAAGHPPPGANASEQ